MTDYEKRWLATRREWVKLNPPNHQGYYICWIGRDLVHSTVFELDHIISRSRQPDLVFTLSNLAPSCHLHNAEKGSLEHRIDNIAVEIDNVW